MEQVELQPDINKEWGFAACLDIHLLLFQKTRKGTPYAPIEAFQK